MRNSFPTFSEVTGWMTFNKHLCLPLGSHPWLYSTHCSPFYSFLGPRINQTINERREQRKLQCISKRKQLSSVDYSVQELVESNWWDVKTKPKQCWKASVSSCTGFNELLEWECNSTTFLLKPSIPCIAVGKTNFYKQKWKKVWSRSNLRFLMFITTAV